MTDKQKTKLIFNLDFTGHLCECGTAFAIIGMFHLIQLQKNLTKKFYTYDAFRCKESKLT